MFTIDAEAVLQRAKSHKAFLLGARYWTARVAFEFGADLAFNSIVGVHL